jgi:hypothetical protein
VAGRQGPGGELVLVHDLRRWPSHDAAGLRWPSACRTSHKVTNSWQGGFAAEATITNTGSSTVRTWRSTWTARSGVTVTNGWNATVTQRGSTVTGTALSWNVDLAPGQSATIGYQANGQAAAPSGVTLNSVACS